MKCDELEKFDATSNADRSAGFDSRYAYDADEVDAAIAELTEVYKDSVDVKVKIWDRYKKAEDELRKTQRALWLERAERAKETQFLWQVYCHCDKLYFCKPFCVSTRKNPYRHISRMNVVEWDEFWGKIKNKCLAKAEEYK